MVGRSGPRSETHSRMTLPPEFDVPRRAAGLEPIFTDEQVAENLHKTVRWLRRFVAKTPSLEVMRAGRTLLFTIRDVERLKAALRSNDAGARPRHRAHGPPSHRR